MKHQLFWSRFFLIASILTAVVIFCFSAQGADDSSQISDSITLQVAQIVRPDYVELPVAARQSFLEKLSTAVRKSAHFLEFALLGFNLMGYFLARMPGLPARGCRLRAWGIATAYAATDEFHQMFVDDRAPRVLDVLIDSAGALTGTLVIALLILLLAKLRGGERG